MLKLKLLIHPRFIRDLLPSSTKLRDSHQKTPSNPFSPRFFLVGRFRMGPRMSIPRIPAPENRLVSKKPTRRRNETAVLMESYGPFLTLQHDALVEKSHRWKREVTGPGWPDRWLERWNHGEILNGPPPKKKPMKKTQVFEIIACIWLVFFGVASF